MKGTLLESSGMLSDMAHCLVFSYKKLCGPYFHTYRGMHPQDMMLPLKCESSSNPQEIYKSIRLGKQCLVNTRKTDFHLSH